MSMFHPLLILFIIAASAEVKVNGQDLNSPESSTSNPTNGGGSTSGKQCNDTSSLDECWKKLPTMKEASIPTTSKEVETACNAYKMGMDCVDKYAQECMTPKQRAQLKSSVTGAHEIFTFLCMEERFRAQFLSHAGCYKKISRKWDGCADHFISSLKKEDQRRSRAVCCIRLRYLQCVSEVARLHCDEEAQRFLLKMAETLVTSNLKGKNNSECSNVHLVNCSQTSGSNSGSCRVPRLKTPYLFQQPSTVMISNVFPYCGNVLFSLVSSFTIPVGHFISNCMKLLSSSQLKVVPEWLASYLFHVGEVVVN